MLSLGTLYFVSEWLIYLGLFRTLGVGNGHSWAGAAFAAPALALIGALAVSCFVKAFGTVFLGTARTDHAKHRAIFDEGLISL